MTETTTSPPASNPPTSLETRATDGADEGHVVEVRRRVPLSAGVGAVAAALAIGYFARATAGGSWLDWLVCVAMALVAAAHLQALVDARAPVLVADSHGVRLRRGRTWRGVTWPEVERIEVRPRHGLLRDGAVRVVPLHESALEVPLSLSTRVLGAGDDLTAALDRVAGGRVSVTSSVRDEGAGTAASAEEADAAASDAETEPQVAPPTTPAPIPSPSPSPSPSPLRRLRRGTRSEVVLPGATALGHGAAAVPGDDQSAGHPDVTDDLEATSAWRLPDEPERRPVARPVIEPVIGPRLVAARERLRLSVDQLAERTRIRPHVIEAIEADDFEPCGGDFYARGHLRTLARVLGIDAAPLLATYDDTYADAPVDPRRVFEAELAAASGRSLRSTRGVNWSVLVAAVMAVVLVWSIARLLTDGPLPVSDGLHLNNSGGIDHGDRRAAVAKVPVRLTAEGGGAHVVVRDGTGRVVLDDGLAFGQSVDLEVVPPIRVHSTDGSLRVVVDGDDQGALGATGREAQNTFVVR